MVLRIARKELLEMTRDGRFRVAGSIILLLLLTALGLGWRWHADVNAAHQTAIAQERRSGSRRVKKSPHSAAHYGVYAFKPTGWLAFFDPGTEAYIGVTVWLEAHKQNSVPLPPGKRRKHVAALWRVDRSRRPATAAPAVDHPARLLDLRRRAGVGNTTPGAELGSRSPRFGARPAAGPGRPPRSGGAHRGRGRFGVRRTGAHVFELRA